MIWLKIRKSLKVISYRPPEDVGWLLGPPDVIATVKSLECTY